MRMFRLITFLTVFTVGGFSVAPLLAADPQPSQVEVLAKELRGSLEYKRMLILDKLAAMNTTEARSVIIRTMLEDKSKPVRRAAQRLLTGIDDPGIHEAVVEGLQSEKRSIRLAAIDVAGIVRDPEMAVQLVRTISRHPKDKELALSAMEALRELVYRMEPPKDFENLVHPFLNDRQKKVRQTAVIILSVMGRPASLEPLMAVWPRADAKIRIHLVDAFSNLGRIAPVSLLLDVLKSRDKTLVMHALYALAQIQSFATLPDIRRVLQTHQDPRVLMACLYALVEIPDQDSIPAILEVMQSQNPTVLHWATYALAQLDATTAGPELIGKLSHPANLVRATAAMALGELKIAEAREPLLAIITNPQEAPEVNVAAARALIRLGDPKGVDVLWKELENIDLPLDSRLAYAVAVGSANREDLKDALLGQLESSQFTRAFTAALILGMMGQSQGREKLISALEHGYPNIRRYAILGLEGIPDEKSVRALADTANDDRDPLVRLLCAASLVRAGYADFRLVLWNVLDTREEDVRAEVVTALGRSADEETIDQLKWYLKREPSIPVKQSIQRVLREWKENH